MIHKYTFKKARFHDIELPQPQVIDRQSGAFLMPKIVDGEPKMYLLILDKLNVNIDEDWGPIGQLPSLN